MSATYVEAYAETKQHGLRDGISSEPKSDHCMVTKNGRTSNRSAAIKCGLQNARRGAIDTSFQYGLYRAIRTPVSPIRVAKRPRRVRLRGWLTAVFARWRSYILRETVS